MEFPALVSSDKSGCKGEGRNKTVSFSGGVAIMYEAFSYSELSVGNDEYDGLEIET